MNTMRAARIVEPGRAEVVEVPVPRPAPGEVRVRVEGCGVCASNLGPWRGLPWLRYPMGAGEGGHEAWGVVDEVGEGTAGPRPGDRVSFLSNAAYAEFAVATADQSLRLPDALSGRPFPGEPLGCAVNVFRRGRIEAGQAVAIVGAGFLGLVVARLASAAGARVLAVGRRRFALDLARRHGAEVALGWPEDRAALAERVRDWTGGRLCDRVVEAVGNQVALDLATELVEVRGTLVVAGYHQDGPRTVNMQLWNWRGIDVVNAHERDPRAYLEGMAAALEAVLTGAIDPGALCTDEFPLDGLGAALDATDRRPDGFVKAVVRPWA